MMGFIIPLIYVIIIQIAFNKFNVNDDVQNLILGIAFPVLNNLGLILTCGVFVFTPVEDRELKLRYLLNFAGMRSSAYYIGYFFADWIIFSINQTLLVLMFFVMKIQLFEDHAWMYYLCVEVFGFAFISSIYALNFFFDKGETSFKYITLFMMIFGILPAGIASLIQNDTFNTVVGAIFPMSALATNTSAIL